MFRLWTAEKKPAMTSARSVVTQSSSGAELEQSAAIVQQFSHILVERSVLWETARTKRTVLERKIEVMAEDCLCMKKLVWDVSHILKASLFFLSSTEKVRPLDWDIPCPGKQPEE